jgi:metal-responsive CopG/Arc/MetJ family transcriptional regulator
MIGSQHNKRRPRMPGTAACRASRKIIVDFPDALYEKTQKAAQELSVTRSGLIREAVHEYLRRMERRKLARELAEGYCANAHLNQELSEEFVHVDADNL